MDFWEINKRPYVPDDIVVAVRSGGLDANTMKYLDGQLFAGVNPDSDIWDGVLLPFRVQDLQYVLMNAILLVV